MSSKNSSTLPWQLNDKYRILRNEGASKEGCPDFALGSGHIVLHYFLWCSHRVKEGLIGHGIMMLATL